MRYLFARFVDVEVSRDASYRAQLASETAEPGKPRPLGNSPSIQLPTRTLYDERQDDLVTLKAANTNVASPGSPVSLAQSQTNGLNNGQSSTPNGMNSGNVEESPNLEKQVSRNSTSRTSMEAPNDRFPGSPQFKNITDNSQESSGAAASPNDTKEEKPGGSLFGKFRVNFPKKLGRSSVEVKRPVIEQKSSEGSLKSEGKEDRSYEQYLSGTLEDIRGDYEAQLRASPSHSVIPAVTPSPPNDIPPLIHPPYTTILIQEEQPDAGGVADLYRGTVSSVGGDAAIVEKCAPRWLGDLLLRVRVSLDSRCLCVLMLLESNAREGAWQSVICLVT